MAERRKFIRLDSSLPIKYRRLDEKASFDKALTKNISGSGICIELKEVLAPGTRIQLEINLPNESKPIFFIGEVVWQDKISSSPHGSLATGIRYIKIGLTQRQKITNYIINQFRNKYRNTIKPTLLSTPPKKSRLIDFFMKEVKLPGDKSRKISLPDFLVKEIKIPGDRTRYAWVESYIKLKYRSSKKGQQEKSLSQYISGEGVLMLLEEELPPGSTIELEITLPATASPIYTQGKVIISQGSLRYNDKEVKIYYDTFVKFTHISSQDRRNIIRYVYSCRADYIKMLKIPTMHQ